MINAEQIRAARAILDWSTADLAKLSGLTVNGINKIERGHVTPQKDTAAALQKTLEEAGIEFLPSGVKKKAHIVQIWDDDEACIRLLDDIYYELRDTGGVISISSVTEILSARHMGKEKIEAHKERLAKSGITERLLTKEGDMNFIGSPSPYRWLPAKYFSPDSFFIYGKKVAIIVWGAPRKVIVINDARMAESVRKLFDFVWDRTKPAPFN